MILYVFGLNETQYSGHFGNSRRSGIRRYTRGNKKLTEPIWFESWKIVVNLSSLWRLFNFNWVLQLATSSGSVHKVSTFSMHSRSICVIVRYLGRTIMSSSRSFEKKYISTCAKKVLELDIRAGIHDKQKETTKHQREGSIWGHSDQTKFFD